VEESRGSRLIRQPSVREGDASGTPSPAKSRSTHGLRNKNAAFSQDGGIKRIGLNRL